MTLVLASASPRRQELLRMVTRDFVVCPAEVDESPGPYQTPAEYALGAAVLKAKTVSLLRLSWSWEQIPSSVSAPESWESPGILRKTGRCWRPLLANGIPC